MYILSVLRNGSQLTQLLRCLASFTNLLIQPLNFRWPTTYVIYTQENWTISTLPHLRLELKTNHNRMYQKQFSINIEIMSSMIQF